MYVDLYAPFVRAGPDAMCGGLPLLWNEKALHRRQRRETSHSLRTWRRVTSVTGIYPETA